MVDTIQRKFLDLEELLTFCLYPYKPFTGQRTIRIRDSINISPQQAKLRVEELKADVPDGGDPATTMQKNFEAERQKEFQQRPLSVWLDNYRSQILGNASSYQREEYSHTAETLTTEQLLLCSLGQYPEDLSACQAQCQHLSLKHMLPQMFSRCLSNL